VLRLAAMHYCNQPGGAAAYQSERLFARAREDPVRGPNKPHSQKEANKAHARLWSPGERAMTVTTH
jgi:hypothetical protein